MPYECVEKEFYRDFNFNEQRMVSDILKYWFMSHLVTPRLWPEMSHLNMIFVSHFKNRFWSQPLEESSVIFNWDKLTENLDSLEWNQNIF